MLVFNRDTIRNIRERNSLTSSSFARQLGITRQLASQWERGHQIPSVGSLLKIVNQYNVSITEFFKHEGGSHDRARPEENQQEAEKAIPV